MTTLTANISPGRYGRSPHGTRNWETTMGWRNVAAGIGTGATVQALKAVESKVSKRKFKRLIATAVAELLALHPDIGKSKARRRARRITGARPSRKLMRTTRQIGLKEGAEAVVGAAATAGLAKVAGVFGEKLKEKFDQGDEQEQVEDRARREPAEA
ncbi:MAG TPA: hypothetical protein VH764_11465 [Gemmatimonadales bacterium]